MSPQNPEARAEQITEGSLRYNLNMHAASHRFKELVGLASEVCLRRPLDTTEKHAITLDPLVEVLGAQGIRAAVELNLTPEIFTENRRHPQTAEQEQDEELIGFTSSITSPESFSYGIDRQSLELAYNFGRQLIKESFAILGQDAYEKARQLAEATSVEEQLGIIGWLDNRIYKITSKGDTLSDTDNPTYHPIRLSPKVVGTYPNIDVAPTCLGVSILATSFLQKAGLKTLHGGVEISNQEYTSIAAFRASRILHQSMTRQPESLTTRVRALGNMLAKATFDNEDAHHAATYAQLLDGSWLQIDPNYSLTTPLHDTNSSKRIDKVATALDTWSGIVPNLQLSYIVAMPETMGEAMAYLVNKAKGFDDKVPRETLVTLIDELLADPQLESVPEKIYKQIIVPTFAALHEAMSEAVGISGEDQKESILRKAFYDSFSKFVLWNQPLEKVVSRMRSDEHYRNRRIDDIASLPYMMTAEIIRTDVGVKYEGGHYSVEFGLPETRIGLAVLNDFGSFMAFDDIPADFWISQWPSSVPPIEFLNQLDGNGAPEYEAIQYNNLSFYTNEHPFTSRRNDGIVQRSTSTDEDRAKHKE